MLDKIFFKTAWPIKAKFLCGASLGRGNSSHDDTGVTLTYFTARSKFGNLGFSMGEKVETVDFSETIAASDMKVGRCRQLTEFMKVREY